MKANDAKKPAVGRSDSNARLGVMGADTPVALHYTYCTATPSAISSFCS
jgi:hypothetical protein